MTIDATFNLIVQVITHTRFVQDVSSFSFYYYIDRALLFSFIFYVMFSL